MTSLTATHGSIDQVGGGSGDSRSSSPALSISTRSSGKSACVNFTTRLINKLKTEGKEREREERKQQLAQREKDKEMHKEV